jgi:hypothetical protein
MGLGGASRALAAVGLAFLAWRAEPCGVESLWRGFSVAWSLCLCALGKCPPVEPLGARALHGPAQGQRRGR